MSTYVCHSSALPLCLCVQVEPAPGQVSDAVMSNALHGLPEHPKKSVIGVHRKFVMRKCHHTSLLCGCDQDLSIFKAYLQHMSP